MADSESNSGVDDGSRSDVADDGSRSDATDDSTSKAQAPSSKSKSKVELLLKATGDAPIMAKKKWAVERVKKVASVLDFIHKVLKCDTGESVFLYVNQSFSPAPDVDIGTLYDCFGTDGKLVLHYCRTQAWG